MNNGEKILTIGIPNYNYGKYLGRAVESALATDRSDIEVIVADNYSTDDSQKIVQSIDDTRLRFFRHSANIGMHSNWNFILNQARGKYIKMLPSDDWLESTFFTSFFELYEGGGNVDVFLLGYNKYIGNRDEPSRKTLPAGYGIFEPFYLESSEQLGLKSLEFSMPTLNIINRELLLEVGGYAYETNMRGDSLAFASVLASKPQLTIAPLNKHVAAIFTHGTNARRNYTPYEAFRDEVLYLRLLNTIRFENGNAEILEAINLNRAGALLYFPACFRKPRGRKMWWRFFKELFSENLITLNLKAFMDLYAMLSEKRKQAGSTNSV
ncbi:glycosyltransferase [bacterium]|nr:glycosyltransferase [bacterium]